jgi:hypothetical protein
MMPKSFVALKKIIKEVEEENPSSEGDFNDPQKH